MNLLFSVRSGKGALIDRKRFQIPSFQVKGRHLFFVIILHGILKDRHMQNLTGNFLPFAEKSFQEENFLNVPSPPPFTLAPFNKQSTKKPHIHFLQFSTKIITSSIIIDFLHWFFYTCTTRIVGVAMVTVPARDGALVEVWWRRGWRPPSIRRASAGRAGPTPLLAQPLTAPENRPNHNWTFFCKIWKKFNK